MSELTIRLESKHEIDNREWLEVVERINQNVLRGDFASISAKIVGGLRKTESCRNCLFVEGVCRDCGAII